MPISFSMSPEQRALQLNARRFGETVLRTVDAATRKLPKPDARFSATRPMYEQAIAAGFLHRLIPAPFGGGGTGLMDMAVVAEEFYAVDVNVSLTLFANLLGLMPVFAAGTPEQQRNLIAPFLTKTGAPLAALANSEPGGSANFGSNAVGTGTRTHARLEGDEWVINGAKHWVSSATGWDGLGADLLTVVCRTDAMESSPAGLSVIAVNRGASGFRHTGSADTLGHRAHLTPRFSFEGTRVPRSNLIGPMGGGKAIIDGSFAGTAALVGVMAVGLMRRAFDFALHFARTEHRGGPHPIIGHQAVGYGLGDAKAALEACRYLSWRACDAMDRQEPGAFELALHAKVYCSETAVRVVTDLMRLVGIDSYDHDLPLASVLQDAMVLPLFDGGNMGVRRRQLHELMQSPGYNAWHASGAAE